jgi:starch phosphorylase
MATTTSTANTEEAPRRERRPSTSAPLTDLQGPVGPGFSRPKHKRTFTGFGAGEIKHVEGMEIPVSPSVITNSLLSCNLEASANSIFWIASIPEPQRAAWTKYAAHGFKTQEDFEREVVKHVETTLARSMFNCDETAAYAAASLAFRDRLITEWNRTQQRQTFADTKRVYYLSLEFLMGRALDNAMLNVGLKDLAKSTISPSPGPCCSPGTFY